MRASSSYARHGKTADRIPETKDNIDGPDRPTNSFNHVMAVYWISTSEHSNTTCVGGNDLSRDVFKDAMVDSKAKARSFHFGSRPRTPMKSYMITEAP